MEKFTIKECEWEFEYPKIEEIYIPNCCKQCPNLRIGSCNCTLPNSLTTYSIL